MVTLDTAIAAERVLFAAGGRAYGSCLPHLRTVSDVAPVSPADMVRLASFTAVTSR